MRAFQVPDETRLDRSLCHSAVTLVFRVVEALTVVERTAHLSGVTGWKEAGLLPNLNADGITFYFYVVIEGHSLHLIR